MKKKLGWIGIVLVAVFVIGGMILLESGMNDNESKEDDMERVVNQKTPDIHLENESTQLFFHTQETEATEKTEPHKKPVRDTQDEEVQVDKTKLPGETDRFYLVIEKNDLFEAKLLELEGGNDWLAELDIQGLAEPVYIEKNYTHEEYETLKEASCYSDWFGDRIDSTLLVHLTDEPVDCYIYFGSRDVPLGMTEGLSEEEIQALFIDEYYIVWGSDGGKEALTMTIPAEGMDDEKIKEIVGNIKVVLRE